MLLDARDLEDGRVLQSRVCVLGAGPAGITCALELAARGVDVLLVESGGFDPEPEQADLATGTSTGYPYGGPDQPIELAQARVRAVGGSTGHWSGNCSPLRPIDLEPKPGIDRTGWPIAHEELARWYPAAAGYLEVDPARFTLDAWSAELGGTLILSDGLEAGVYQQSPVRFGARYRAELEASEHVTLLVHATAVRLEADPAGRGLLGVGLKTLDGRRSRVEAGAFVLALGGLDNPRMLLASNDVRPDGLGNEHDQVGRYFCEHADAVFGFALFARSLAELAPFFGVEGAGVDGASLTPITVVLAASEAELRRGEVLASEIAFRLEGFPQAQTTQVEGAETSAVAALLGAEGLGVTTIGIVRAVAEQHCSPASRVTLARERDVLGVPRLTLEWAVSDLDRRTLQAAYERAGRWMLRQRLGRLQIVPGGVERGEFTKGFASSYVVDPAAIDLGEAVVGINFHHLCTTRMSDSAKRGVVDADCRVHSVENLWVAGSSVFATGAAAAPTYTIVALAARLADTVARAVGA